MCEARRRGPVSNLVFSGLSSPTSEILGRAILTGVPAHRPPPAEAVALAQVERRPVAIVHPRGEPQALRTIGRDDPISLLVEQAGEDQRSAIGNLGGKARGEILAISRS